MEIQRGNLISAGRFFLEKLRKCNFVAIDLEYTGIGIEKSKYRYGYHDTRDERYFKTKLAADLFVPIQIGLCIFSWDKRSSSYIYYPFGAYLLQRRSDDLKFKARGFFSSSSSLEALANSNYDFNSWIHNGVSYLRKDEERDILKKIISSLKKKNEDSLLEQDIAEKIVEWVVNSFSKPRQIYIEDASKISAISKFIATNFPSIKCTPGKNCVSLSDGRDYLKKGITCPIKELKKLVGIRSMIDMIVESKTPVVFHNGFIDILFLYQTFVAPLPPKLKDFKLAWMETFPRLYDTKYSFSVVSPGLQSKSSLQGMFEECNSKGYKLPEIKHYKANGTMPVQFHNSIFDAYATGFSFLRLISKYSNFKQKIPVKILPELDESILNVVNIGSSFLRDLRLDAKDKICDSKNLYVVYDIQEGTTTADVLKEFRRDILGKYSLEWKNENTLVLSIHPQSIYTMDMYYISRLSGSIPKKFDYKILTFSDYAENVFPEKHSELEDYSRESIFSDDKTQDADLTDVMDNVY